MYAKKNVSVKVLVVLLCVVLLIGGAIGGTVAYLMTNTDPVTNTFTAGDVDIKLEEKKFDADKAIMVPGHTIEKDPVVTVIADSEDCYVFVKIEKSTNFDIYMEYEVITGEGGWTKLDGVEDIVYYREVTKGSADQPFSILEGNKVTVKSAVDKTTMNQAESNQPTLTFTAYAIQKYSSNETEFGAAKAWEQINATP